MKVVAIVGMAGSGKSEVSRVFEDNGFTRIRFGDITDEEIRKRGLELNEESERYVREFLRRKYGMAVYAQLNLPRIDEASKYSDVVVDGLYSWEEYIFLKTHYDENFITIAVWASPETRYARLRNRKVRPLTYQDALSRDYAEIENLDKGGPIAMADYTVINGSSLSDMQQQVERIISRLK